MSRKKPVILFLCVHNAGRSQMAAGFARAFASGRVEVHSAGSAPGETLNPAVVAAMAEEGVDISHEAPQRITEEMARSADVVVTMGCGDACPVFPGKRYLDWPLEDPMGKGLGEVRQIREQIRELVASLVDELSLEA